MVGLRATLHAADTASRPKAAEQLGWCYSVAVATLEISICELRNADGVISELASTGATGRVTSGGRLVGWLVPATPSEQRAEELHVQGRLRYGRPGGLAGQRPLPHRTNVEPLTHALDEQRRTEDR